MRVYVVLVVLVSALLLMSCSESSPTPNVDATIQSAVATQVSKALTTPTPLPELVVYTHPDGSYQIAVPAGWKIWEKFKNETYRSMMESVGANWHVMELFPSSDTPLSSGDEPRLVVTGHIGALQEYGDLDSWATVERESMESAESVQLVSMKKVEVNGYSAYESVTRNVVYIGDQTVDIQEIRLILLPGIDGYEIEAYTPLGKWEAQEVLLRRLAYSFQPLDLVFVPTVTPTPTRTPTPAFATTRTYVHPVYKDSISYPVGWSMFQIDDLGLAITQFYSPAGAPIAAVWMDRYGGLGIKNSNLSWSQFGMKVSKEYSEFQLLSNELVTVSGIDAYERQYLNSGDHEANKNTTEFRGSVVHVMELSLVSGTSAYNIKAVTPEEHWQYYASLLREVLYSFKPGVK